MSSADPSTDAGRSASGPERAEEVFARALLLSAAEREAFLSASCGGDEALRGEVASLLEHHEADAAFLEEPASGSFSRSARGSGGDDEATALPAWIGHYRILGVLGEGGMGVVYEAEQESPKRRVALKVLRAVGTGGSALRRFQQEAAALGRLQHPGIAQVYEAGTDTSTGTARPFLAMELVRGRPLNQFAQGLRVRARLELFVRVCDAVQHAHQRGVIHRDLKPGNILVEEGMEGTRDRGTESKTRTGTGLDASTARSLDACLPKVLDFGVAALLDPQQQATMHTRTGELIGTVAYMSPEQIGGEAAEVDARSDIYSLGVILFEMLSGRLPHDVRRKPLAEAVRLVRESDPTRLSTLAREFRGDLDTIVGKALEREPQRRYRTAGELAADVRRFMADEPIAARPPSTVYQVGKFARRHKPLVGAAGVVLATLVVAQVVITNLWLKSLRAEATARDEASRAETVSSFLTNLLTGISPALARGKDTELLRMMLTDAEKRMDELAGRPLVEVQVRAAVGRTYSVISQFGDGQRHLERAVEVGRASLPADHPVLLDALQGLNALYTYRERFADALKAAQEVYDGWLRREGPMHPQTLLATNNLGKGLLDVGRSGEAEALLRRAAEGQERVLGPEHPDTLRSLSNLASLLSSTKRFEEAEPLFRRVLETRRRTLGEDHPETLIVMTNFGVELDRRKRGAEAEPLLVRALELRRKLLGDEHMETLMSMNNVAALYMATGRVDEAADMTERLAAAAPRVLGEEHGLTTAAYHQLATLRRSQKRYEEAAAAEQRALEIARKTLPAGHPRTAIFACATGRILIFLERYAEAEALLLEGHAALEKLGGKTNATTLTAVEMLADLYKASGNAEQEQRWRGELEAGRAAAESAKQTPVTGGG